MAFDIKGAIKALLGFFSLLVLMLAVFGAAVGYLITREPSRIVTLSLDRWECALVADEPVAPGKLLTKDACILYARKGWNQ